MVAGRRLLVRPLGGITAWATGADRAVPAWAVISAALSPVILTVGWLTADLVQPASYSPVRQTVSVLAGRAGTDPWIMTGALFLVGGCNLATAVGLRGVGFGARLLLTLAALASIGIAACPEPAHGSTPQHLAWTAFGAIVIAIWPAFVLQRSPSRTRLPSVYSLALMTAASIALFCWAALETQGGSALGLAERLSSTVQITWPFVVALALWRAKRSDNPTPTA
jgi:hypothetical membrane protein